MSTSRAVVVKSWHFMHKIRSSLVARARDHLMQDHEGAQTAGRPNSGKVGITESEEWKPISWTQFLARLHASSRISDPFSPHCQRMQVRQAWHNGRQLTCSTK